MIKNLLLICVIGLSLFSCKSSKETAGVWVNEKKTPDKTYNKLFIIVLTADIQSRVRLESDLAEVARSRGLEVVKSLDVLPFSLDNPKLPTKEEVVEKVKESGADAVFVASLLRKEEDLRYVEGKEAYSIMPYYQYHGTFTGFYSYLYNTVSIPAYYAHDRKYFVVSNLYESSSAEILWSVQSNIFDPETLERFSKSYTNRLIYQLQSAKLIKKVN